MRWDAADGYLEHPCRLFAFLNIRFYEVGIIAGNLFYLSVNIMIVVTLPGSDQGFQDHLPVT